MLLILSRICVILESLYSITPLVPSNPSLPLAPLSPLNVKLNIGLSFVPERVTVTDGILDVFCIEAVHVKLGVFPVLPVSPLGPYGPVSPLSPLSPFSPLKP